MEETKLNERDDRYRRESKSSKKSSKDEKDRRQKKDKKAHKSHRSSKHKSEKKEHKHDRKSEKAEKESRSRMRRQDQISEQDYFSKNLEFKVYLFQHTKKGSKGFKNFEDLSSDEAHKLFRDYFVPDYNEGKLNEMFYTGKYKIIYIIIQYYTQFTKFTGGFPTELVREVSKTHHK